MIGKLLGGRYQIVEILAAGGFAQTYIAKDAHRPGNPKCVVKHLKPASSESSLLQNARRLFQSEAETLENLGNHDRIPRLLAHFEENQEFYLVQEFIAGHPLSAELLPGQCWSESQVVQLLQEVLGILEFVHNHGLIHRDIKPSNLIRRQQDNRLVLVDFGSVKQTWTQVVTAQGQTSTSFAIAIAATIAIGTPGYTPTEQGRGRPRPNSDIYALGMIGIQALTGLHPTQLIEDSDTGEFLWQHQALVSDALASVLTKMVRYHFKDRYQTAAEVLQALQLVVKRSGDEKLLGEEKRAGRAFQRSASRGGEERWGGRGSEGSKGSGHTYSPIHPLLPYSFHSLHFPNFPTLSSSPAFFWAGITAVLISMVAGYAIYWQPRTNIQKTLEQIETLKAEGKYEECVNRSTTVPQVSHFYTDAQALLHECQLAQAMRLAAERNFTAAIIEAGKLPLYAAVHQEAQQLIDQWSDSIVEIATKQYQSGNLNDAIAIVSAIPKTSAVYKKSQGAIQQWNGEWEKNNFYLKAAKNALDEGRWQNAISSAKKVIDTPYWKERIEPIIQKAESKIAQSKTAVTSKPTRPATKRVTPATRQPTRPATRRVTPATRQPTRPATRRVTPATRQPTRPATRRVTSATRRVKRSTLPKPLSRWTIETR